MIELMKQTSKSSEFISAVKQSTFDTLGLMCTPFADTSMYVVSNEVIENVWSRLKSKLLVRYPSLEKIEMPLIAAICVPPKAFDYGRNHDFYKVDHEEEYGMSEEEWHKIYKSGGFLHGSYLILQNTPSLAWFITIRGQSYSRAMSIIKHEIRHIFEYILSLKVGALQPKRKES